jgi:hypothetical protein
MIQTVKTIIRWRDEDGCVLGSIREREIDLPKWGKRHFLREEINRHIVNLCWDQHQVGTPERFIEYALKSFNPSQIIRIQSRTKGSYILLKDDELKKFLEANKLK